MQITTSRFGSVQIEIEDILRFPRGLIGFEDARHWVLLADSQNSTVGWLQSVGHPDLAVPVVSPRRFVADYRIRVVRSQLGVLELAQLNQAHVLAIVGKDQNQLTLNLKAPIIINLDRKVGCQVITSDEQPLHHPLAEISVGTYRKSA